MQVVDSKFAWYVVAMLAIWLVFLKDVRNVFTRDDFPDPRFPITRTLMFWHCWGGFRAVILSKSWSLVLKVENLVSNHEIFLFWYWHCLNRAMDTVVAMLFKLIDYLLYKKRYKDFLFNVKSHKAHRPYTINQLVYKTQVW